MKTNRYGHLVPVTEGVWERIAPRHYQHISGIEVIHRPNRWVWQVVGGPDDGHSYGTLSVAQHAATKHFDGV